MSNNDDLTGLTWTKSSHSGNDSNCVEVAFLSDDRVALRDSKDPHGPVLRFNRGEWSAFVNGITDGELRQS